MELKEVLKQYEVVRGRKPKKEDLVFVPSQQEIFEVESVEAMNVTVERSHKGSGLKLKLPPSHYMLLQKKK